MFVYDKLSRIKEESVEGNVKHYAYDKRGNRQVYTNAPADILRSYEMKHDLFNRLAEYKDDKGKTTYTYYPGGLRATKQQTGSVTDTTHYVYLNGQVIEELTQDGRVKARNVFGNQLIWRKDYASNREGTYYYNSHGDVVKIKDSSGNVLNSYDYDIWGNLITDKVKETIYNPFMYAGEMYDKESGFYYLRARYYDPKIGRFISEDTYKGQVDNPLSMNRYTYTHNNPLRFIDPTGHAVVEDLKKGWRVFTNAESWERSWEVAKENLPEGVSIYVQDQVGAENYQVLTDGNLAVEDASAVVMAGGELVFGRIKALKKAANATEKILDTACNCFTAGTKVLTDEGEKPIEEIEVGDKVLAKDDESGEMAYKEVEWLFQRDVKETYKIRVGGEVITTTDEHPFWIVGKGWVESKNLEVGDVLTTSDYKELAIEKIEVKKEHKTVYNFKVKDFHTYFVSNLGIWTHNSCNISGSQLSQFAKNSKANDGLPGAKVSLNTVYDAAKDFVGPNFSTLSKNGYTWYYSESGTKRVRVMNKKGKNDVLEANFETFKDPWQWEKEGNRQTNYHVEIK